MFALTCAARSNGLLHCAYLLFDAAEALRMRWDGGGARARMIAALAGTAVAFVARSAVVAAPLLANQFMGHRAFCNVEGSAWRATPRPWCASWSPTALYSFVQVGSDR